MLLKSLFAVVVCGLLVVNNAPQSDEVNLEGVKCVVAGGNDVNKDSWVEYRGAKVYFCCDECKAAFTKDPSAYAPAANYQLVRTGQFVQKACPLMNKPFKDDISFTVADVDVHFCCKSCQKRTEKAETPEAQIDLIFADKPFEQGFALKPAASAEKEGG
jgi:YHS domain-containing protein